ncbi:transferase [Mycolicibacterium canariasense]|uniref:Transferase n=1 Tax=Mycolicibacterium canariasense TaxID=228230 RepID=A0A124E376_MYCCR|nr:glycosyltransferase family 9 protein [Mycolicibacterium canariasense]MCV7208222.1 glycosyltransferase family 9 protein [Mycolicibacterium canariasense]ORV09443.1 glycosyl transferase [Mycolicibacterium canariasense]GAS99034.1 transferase [Mycolicibacterium canariasense]
MSGALVARLDSAGDVLITGPAVRAVAAAHGPVTLLVGPRGRAAAELLPGVRGIVEWQAPWVDFGSPPVTAAHVDRLLATLGEIAPERVYIATSFHQSPLPLALLCRMAGVPWIGAISEDYPGTLLDLRHHVPAGIPEPERALSLARAAGCALPPDDAGELRVPAPDLSTGLRRVIGRGEYVVFHPGAAVPARQPSVRRSERMVAALVAAGHRVVVTGDTAERGQTAYVAGDVAVDLGGRTSFAELAAVFAAARVVVAPNTGPAHLAAAVGTPVVSLFAPVVPASQWMPYARRVIRLGDQNAPCRDSRARTCPIPGHPCLDGISDAEVVTAVEESGDNDDRHASVRAAAGY